MDEFKVEQVSASAVLTPVAGDQGPHHAYPPKTGDVVRELRFSTRGFVRDSQFETWRGLTKDIADFVPLDDVHKKSGFMLDATAYDLGKLGATLLHSDGSVFRRGADHVRQSTDHWVLCYRSSGAYRSESGSRLLDAGPGTLWMKSLAYPFEGRAEPLGQRPVRCELVHPGDLLVFHLAARFRYGEIDLPLEGRVDVRGGQQRHLDGLAHQRRIGDETVAQLNARAVRQETAQLGDGRLVVRVYAEPRDQGLLRDASWPGIKAWTLQNPGRVQEMLWLETEFSQAVDNVLGLEASNSEGHANLLIDFLIRSLI